MNIFKEAVRAHRKARIADLNDWLVDSGDWVLTLEGLKESAIKEGKLRIADYGVCDDFGETVIIGLLSDLEAWATKKGYVQIV